MASAIPSAAPVYLFFFANADPVDAEHLRGLSPELERLRRHGEALRDATGVEPRFEADATRDHLIRTLTDPDLRPRIVGVHFAGHAAPDRWVMRDGALDGEGEAAAHAEGVLALLAKLPALRLVVLNGCSTAEQAAQLVEAGVPAVVGTEAAIADDAALLFSDWLYRALAHGAAVRAAFEQARDAVLTHRGDDPGALWRMARPRGEVGRGFPWALSLRPADPEAAAGWRLADALDDPLAGLPAPPPGPLPASPYRHVERFTGRETAVFFGRRAEIRRLYDRLTAPDGAPVVLLYGASGVGKSSLLEAGVAPRLEAGGRRVRVHRHDPATALVDGLRRCLGGDDWPAAEAAEGAPIVAVVDQVEEAIIAADGRTDAIDALVDAIADAFDALPGASRPAGRVVLSFRKGYLAEVTGALRRRDVPYAPVYIEPLGREAVVEIVEGPTRTARLRDHYQLALEDGLAELIADDLTAGQPAAVAPILQILLTRMWGAAVERPVRFDRARYAAVSRDGVQLGEVFRRQLDLAERQAPPPAADGLMLDLLEWHTTDRGTAAHRDPAALAARYPGASAALVEAAVSHRLMTRWAGGDEAGTRLAHDVWGPLVLETFRRSERPGQRARRILENRAVDWPGDAAPTLDAHDLARVEAGLPAMRAPSETEAALLAASRVEVAAERRRRRAWRIFGAAAVVLIAVTAVLAFALSLRLGDALDEEEAARAAAERSAAEAERSAARLRDVTWMRLAQDHQRDPTLAAAALREVVGRAEIADWLPRVVEALGSPMAWHWLPADQRVEQSDLDHERLDELVGLTAEGRVAIREWDPERGAFAVRVVDPRSAETRRIALPVGLRPLHLALDDAGAVYALTLAAAPGAASGVLTVQAADGRPVGAPFECPAADVFQVRPVIGSRRWLFAGVCDGRAWLVDAIGRRMSSDVASAMPAEGTAKPSRPALLAVDPGRPRALLCAEVAVPVIDAAAGSADAVDRRAWLLWVDDVGAPEERRWREAIDGGCPDAGLSADGRSLALHGGHGARDPVRWTWLPAALDARPRPWLGVEFTRALREYMMPGSPLVAVVDPRRVLVSDPWGAEWTSDAFAGEPAYLWSEAAFATPGWRAVGEPSRFEVGRRLVVDPTRRFAAQRDVGVVRLWSTRPRPVYVGSLAALPPEGFGDLVPDITDLTFADDAARLFVADARGAVHVVDLDGGAVERLFALGDRDAPGDAGHWRLRAAPGGGRVVQVRLAARPQVIEVRSVDAPLPAASLPPLAERVCDAAFGLSDDVLVTFGPRGEADAWWLGGAEPVPIVAPLDVLAAALRWDGPFALERRPLADALCPRDTLAARDRLVEVAPKPPRAFFDPIAGHFATPPPAPLTITGSGSPVMRLSVVSPDGRLTAQYMTSGGAMAPGALRVGAAGDARDLLLGPLREGWASGWMRFSPDGRWLVTIDVTGRVERWPVTVDAAGALLAASSHGCMPPAIRRDAFGLSDAEAREAWVKCEADRGRAWDRGTLAVP